MIIHATDLLVNIMALNYLKLQTLKLRLRTLKLRTLESTLVMYSAKSYLYVLRYITYRSDTCRKENATESRTQLNKQKNNLTSNPEFQQPTKKAQNPQQTNRTPDPKNSPKYRHSPKTTHYQSRQR